MIHPIYCALLTFGLIALLCEFARARKRRKPLPPPQQICNRDYKDYVGAYRNRR